MQNKEMKDAELKWMDNINQEETIESITPEMAKERFNAEEEKKLYKNRVKKGLALVKQAIIRAVEAGEPIVYLSSVLNPFDKLWPVCAIVQELRSEGVGSGRMPRT